MKRHKNDALLLREYVKAILVEDESMGMGNYGSAADMNATFIQPFTDVFKTAAAETKMIGVKAKTVVWVGLQTVLTTLLPFYGYDYAEVFDKEKEEINKIKSEYKDVYDRTWNALKNSDAMMLAFMASPAIFLGGVAAKETPKVVKGILATFTGGLSDEIGEKTKSAAISIGRKAIGDTHRSYREKEHNDNSRRSSRVTSDAISFAGGGLAGGLAGTVVEKIKNSKKASAMQMSAQNVYKQALSEKVKLAIKLTQNVSSIEDLQKEVKKSKMPGSGKFDAQVAEIKKLPPEEKEKAEKALLVSAREAAKKFYIEKLESELKQVTENTSLKSFGVDSDQLDFVKDYKRAISTVKSIGIKKN
jgi:hypothetical protein